MAVALDVDVDRWLEPTLPGVDKTTDGVALLELTDITYVVTEVDATRTLLVKVESCPDAA